MDENDNLIDIETQTEIVKNKQVDIPHIGRMTVDHYCSVIQLVAIAQEYNPDKYR